MTGDSPSPSPIPTLVVLQKPGGYRPLAVIVEANAAPSHGLLLSVTSSELNIPLFGSRMTANYAARRQDVQRHADLSRGGSPCLNLRGSQRSVDATNWPIGSRQICVARKRVMITTRTVTVCDELADMAQSCTHFRTRASVAGAAMSQKLLCASACSGLQGAGVAPTHVGRGARDRARVSCADMAVGRAIT